MAKKDKVVKYALGAKVFDVRIDRDGTEFMQKVLNGNHSKYIPYTPKSAAHDFKVSENQQITLLYKRKSPETPFSQIKKLARAAGGYRRLEV